MAAWFAAHQDRDALKRDLETARLAWADIRHAEDVLAAPSVAGRGIIVEVTDGDGEKRSVVRMPYRFSAAASGPVRGVPEPGEHTDDILRDWTRHGQLPGHPACPAPGVPSAAHGAGAWPGRPQQPQRCGIDAVITVTMLHRSGYAAGPSEGREAEVTGVP
jgi:hypothetical protein